MPLGMMGALAGLFISVIIPLVWTTGGAGAALLVPLYALVLMPSGWAIGKLAERLFRDKKRE